ncbi:MAG: hypothetical protein ABSB42_03455 [Tepidisphaeraceae bacterium]
MRMSFISLAVCCGMIAGCASVESQWQEAQQKNVVGAYQAFIDRNSDAPQANEAREKIQQIELAQKDEAAFQMAKDARTVEAIEGYLKDFPSGTHRTEAESIDEALTYDRIRRDTSSYTLGRFLERFPRSSHVPEVAARLKEVDAHVRQERFQEAKQAGTIKAYENFLSLYPTGPDSDEFSPIAKAARLGELAIEMAGTGSLTGNQWGWHPHFESGASPDPEKLAEFRQLVESGADPSLIRISGFQAPSVVPIGNNGAGRTDFGSSGYVVPAASGGMTLLDYLDATENKQAHDILNNSSNK